MSKWDVHRQVFVCVDCGDVTSTDSSYLGSRHTRLIDTPEQKKLQCECGSSKLGSDRHSSWCPLGVK